ERGVRVSRKARMPQTEKAKITTDQPTFFCRRTIFISSNNLKSPNGVDSSSNYSLQERAPGGTMLITNICTVKFDVSEDLSTCRSYSKGKFGDTNMVKVH